MRKPRPVSRQGFLLTNRGPDDINLSTRKGVNAYRRSGLLIFFLALLYIQPCLAFTTETSFYTNVETHGRRCADGKFHNLSKELVAASWDYPFGTILKVTNNDGSGKSCLVIICDRGPAKRLYRMGRRLDLSKGAFSKLAPLKSGLISVTVKETK